MTAAFDTPRAVLVMGVSGCGKSTVGAALADRLGARFIEGDDLHPADNRAKMAAGTPLTDGDRWPWLDAVGWALGEAAHRDGVAVAACSALKASYRAALAEAAGLPLIVVHVHADPNLIRERMATRAGHFMPVKLLESQLAALEPPTAAETAIRLDAACPIEDLIDNALQYVRAS
jgi:gluconokinase